MKKNTFILILILVCFQQVKAQDYERMQKTARTESNHAIDIGFVGAGYTYEYAFNNKFTLNLGAGIMGSVGYASSSFSGSYSYYSFHPYLKIEPRYYYNLQRRLEKGKNIYDNQGSFFAVECAYVFKPFAEHNVHYESATFGFAPYWGLRRIWWEHFLFEFGAGLSFGFNNYSNSKVGIHIGIRLGYKF